MFRLPLSLSQCLSWFLAWNRIKLDVDAEASSNVISDIFRTATCCCSRCCSLKLVQATTTGSNVIRDIFKTASRCWWRCCSLKLFQATTTTTSNPEDVPYLSTRYHSTKTCYEQNKPNISSRTNIQPPAIVIINYLLTVLNSVFRNSISVIVDNISKIDSIRN